MEMAKSVKFNQNVEIKYISEVSSNNTDNDTDYEEENENPIEILKSLMKKKSFGIEEFGQDYESNIELRRKVEITFNNLQPTCKTCNRDMGVMNLNEYKLLFK